MRLPCRRFKCVCMSVFFFFARRGGVCLLHCTCLCSHVCVFMPLHLRSLPGVATPHFPFWTSSSPPQLPSFSFQLPPFRLVTARALNFHGCCLFLARSSSLLFCFLPSWLPSFLPYSTILSLATFLLPTFLLSSHFSLPPLSLIFLNSHSLSPSLPIFILQTAFLCYVTQQWVLLEESITRKFDTPLWFLTLENSTEFQVTVNLSKPFPICPSLLCLLFAHLKDCIACVCVSSCVCMREKKLFFSFFLQVQKTFGRDWSLFRSFS